MHSTQYGDENSLDLNITVLFPSLSVSLSVSPRACRCIAVECDVLLLRDLRPVGLMAETGLGTWALE